MSSGDWFTTFLSFVLLIATCHVENEDKLSEMLSWF